MKKVLFTAFILASAIFANAQETSKATPFQAGKISVGGYLGINSNSSSSEFKSSTGNVNAGPENRNFNFGLGVLGQYFMSSNISVGASLGLSSYSNSSKNGNNESRASSTTFSIAPLARYYYMLDDKFGFFGQAAIPFSLSGGTSETINNGNSSGKTETSGVGVGLSLSPGLIFFPTKRVGFEAGLGNLLGVGINSTVSKFPNNGGESTSSSTNFSLLNINTLSFTLGFQYYF